MIREMLKRHEGMRLGVYICPARKHTIGVGWNIDARPLPDDIALYLKQNNQITEEMSDRLLDISIESATKDCQRIYPNFDMFSESRQEALIDFVFNVGVGTALKFRNMLAAIVSGNWDKAANELYYSQWRTQVGPSRANEIIHMVREG